MPFVSKAQSRFMHANHPDIAARWDKEFPNQKALPERLGKTHEQKAKAKLARAMQGKKR